jgi:hypothetical protein
LRKTREKEKHTFKGASSLNSRLGISSLLSSYNHCLRGINTMDPSITRSECVCNLDIKDSIYDFLVSLRLRIDGAFEIRHMSKKKRKER